MYIYPGNFIYFFLSCQLKGPKSNGIPVAMSITSTTSWLLTPVSKERDQSCLKKMVDSSTGQEIYKMRFKVYSTAREEGSIN